MQTDPIKMNDDELRTARQVLPGLIDTAVAEGEAEHVQAFTHRLADVDAEVEKRGLRTE